MITNKQLEILVEAWHNSDENNTPLHKYLGWTRAEYRVWVQSGITPDRFTNNSLYNVLQERMSQDSKWGEQNHDPFTWISILMEEVGEFAQAANQTRWGGEKAEGLRLEAIQVAAVALAIVECLDRGQWSWPETKKTSTTKPRKSKKVKE